MQETFGFKIFSVDGQRFLVLLPSDMEQASPLGSDETATFKSSRGLRTTQFIQFSTLDSLAVDQYPYSVTLTGGAILRYKIVISEDTGSGGPEADLIGVLDFGTDQISVQCHDQDERKPQPRWCISSLHHIRMLDPS